MSPFTRTRRPAPAALPPEPRRDIFNRPLPYNERLETIAARYRIWRIGAEPDRALARRATLAICEAIEERAQEIATMEAELDLMLGFEKP